MLGRVEATYILNIISTDKSYIFIGSLELDMFGCPGISTQQRMFAIYVGFRTVVKHHINLAGDLSPQWKLEPRQTFLTCPKHRQNLPQTSKSVQSLPQDLVEFCHVLQAGHYWEKIIIV